MKVLLCAFLAAMAVQCLAQSKLPRLQLTDFALSLENPANVINRWMDVKYYGLPADYYDHFSEEVAKVNADAVQRMARKYIGLNHLQIVVVGDAKDVRAAVEKYGAVETFDAEGKPVVAKPEAAGGNK